ncbi:MAG TPA: TIGR04053 family radical SAM/SPASM domain-containing protein [Polyangiales bacterium]
MRNAPAARPTTAALDTAPYITFWETTRACDLACKHCRACAQPVRDLRELSTEEGFQLLTEIRALGCPLLVLTGGDPAKRHDLLELVQYGHGIGLRMALTPSATPLLTPELLKELHGRGLARLALSLDGLEETHDSFRGVRGAYPLTLQLLEAARAIGLTTQINTSVGYHNRHELPQLARLVEALSPELWSVFFIVPTGRASQTHMLSAEHTEEVLTFLAARVREVRHDIKTTAAPHFRRVLMTNKQDLDAIVGLGSDGIARHARGINDGQGVAFISHIGDIYPSGFLPIACGNVREEGLTATYREHPLFTRLRDPDQLRGKCGACPFKRVCGGSRARAHGMTGDPFAEDPVCAYVPPGYKHKRLSVLRGA